LKIALVILHADPSRGGAERYTFDLAQSLASRGHDISLIASTFGPKPPAVHAIELGQHGATKLGQYRQFLKTLRAHLDQDRYDIVHAMLPVDRCDLYHPHAGIAAEAIASGHRKHAGALKQAAASFFNRLNLKRTAFANVERALLTAPKPPIVLCLSEYVKETVRRHYNLPPDHLATLFNAVDLAKYDPAARPQSPEALRAKFKIDPTRTIALMIAQDFARKGLDVTLRALAAMPARPLLLVVGKEDPSPYIRMASELNISNDVIFAGPTTDPVAFYAAADFFVLPTRHDPCSLVVLESLAMGVPVISTNQNGACEIMTTGRHGYVLDRADDQKSLISAMISISDPTVRLPMREQCLALRPLLSYETHLNMLLEIYARARHG
jgi:UDP-glucose:(heptosyl)LPS alpha-1,3-glucosyltransferase